MKYWDDIDSRLIKLIKNGYCFLPSIKSLIDTDKYYEIIMNETRNKSYNENCNSHIKLLNEFGFNDILAPKLFDLSKSTFNYTGSIKNQYHIVRNVFPNQLSESYRGHFDSHLFTLIIPINIPDSDFHNNGQLAFFPKARNLPQSEIINFLQKLYFKRFNSKKGFQALSVKKEILYENFLNYRPLIFLGMLTFHGNLPISDCYRQTLLSHYFDPSPSWGVGSLLRNIRKR
tara:strand:+ start:1285 stop:1974 length:690 start_codon:yes stop_codon:yes gene_type:complete